MPADRRTVLEVSRLTMDFGGLRALDGLDLAVREGEIATLIGPNGAGKTTLFNCLTGLYRPSGGEICHHTARGERAERIERSAPEPDHRRGLARTFQNIRLFTEMTALENVMVGRHCRTRAGVLGAVLRTPAQRREETAIAERS